MRWDGLGAIIQYGSGGHINHCVMALRMDGDLYIVESTDGGIQRTLWDEWMAKVESTGDSLTYHRLSAETRAKFDEKKAQDFVNDTLGLPYGYHNFLFGVVDTANDNFPPLIPREFFPIVFKIVEDIKPILASNMFTEALNFRLNVTDKDISEIAELAAQQSMSVLDVMAMPEMDGWEYTGIEPVDGRSWVCSAYVTAMFKAAGVFGDLEVNSTEFTPFDVYVMNLYDTETPLPDACVAADPDLPYCQLKGKYRVTMPYYNTIEPYNRMFERCDVNFPTYHRDPGC